MSRLAIVETKVRDLEAESQRTRDRLHLVERSETAMEIHIEALKRISDNIRATAKDAATEAVRVALTQRDAVAVDRSGLRASWAMLAVSIAGIFSTMLVAFLK